MSVRAKFITQNIEKNGADENGNDLFFIHAYPVIQGSPENEEFYKWTPGGQIQLGTINAKAASEFKVGQPFYVDFTQAPAEEEEKAPTPPSDPDPALS